MERLASMMMAVCGVVLLAGTAAGQKTDSFQWSGVVPAGGSLEIRGVNGDIVAEPAAGSQVQVRAAKTGRKSDPREVRIEVVQDAQGVLLCAVYPSRDERRPNRCAREGYRASTHDNDVQVDYTVQVPAGVRLVAQTVNGAVRASGLTGDVEATTVNGKIELATAGAASAQTVNGSIEAHLGGSWEGARAFQTVNGSVTLTLPADARVDVSGRTVNGGLKTDFPLTIQANRSWGPRSFEGTIGGGGGGLAIQTVNGAIHLRRGR